MKNMMTDAEKATLEELNDRLLDIHEGNFRVRFTECDVYILEELEDDSIVDSAVLHVEFSINSMATFVDGFMMAYYSIPA